MTNSIRIKKIYGKQIANYLEPIAKLRISVFKEYPYLYDGSWEYEKEYLEVYVKSPDSIAVLAFVENKIVGVSTALPMKDEMFQLQQPFVDHNYDINTVFYFGESILLPEYRGQGIYKLFMEARELQARSFAQYKIVTFCAVDRAPDHPLIPQNYQPLHSIWQKYGFVRYEELIAKLEWKEITETKESEKPLIFYIKHISKDSN